MYRDYVKRIIDVIISAIALIVLFIPMIVIAIVINIEGKGGALFKQERLGKNKKKFIIYKFRTMIPNAFEIGGTDTYEGDSRITKVGAFLRKTSLDELPQFINILKGEMAIIGPRPILEFEENEVDYPELYEERFLIRPGLFCTVDLDLRAMASRKLQFEKDKEYYYNISFLEDLKIFMGVIKTVLTGKNVYKEKTK